MTKPSDNDAQDGAGRSARHLGQIAEALGLPLEAFLGGGPVCAESARVDELLRLWSALDREADRQSVLHFMRALAIARANP